jgi:hypothetical protein
MFFMKNGPTITERFIHSIGNLGLLAASLFFAPTVRDLVEKIASRTTGLPVSPHAQVAFVIAKEAIGYLGTPILLKGAAWCTQKLSAFGWSKLKKKPQPQKDTHPSSPPEGLRGDPLSTPELIKDTQMAVASQVAVPRLAATPKSMQERLDCLLAKCPQVQILVEQNPACWTRLSKFEQLEAKLPTLEACSEERLVDLLTKIGRLPSRS